MLVCHIQTESSVQLESNLTEAYQSVGYNYFSNAFQALIKQLTKLDSKARLT